MASSLGKLGDQFVLAGEAAKGIMTGIRDIRGGSAINAISRYAAEQAKGGSTYGAIKATEAIETLKKNSQLASIIGKRLSQENKKVREGVERYFSGESASTSDRMATEAFVETLLSSGVEPQMIMQGMDFESLSGKERKVLAKSLTRQAKKGLELKVGKEITESLRKPVTPSVRVREFLILKGYSDESELTPEDRIELKQYLSKQKTSSDTGLDEQLSEAENLLKELKEELKSE